MDNSGKNKKGSVLVVGGGIAGMQASLDCAELGFKVYLLEKEPAIGGNMARLDKTFPTNDCAMCMISPKLVETGRHLNIEIISYADLEKVEGEAGDFTVTVNKKSRFVDEDLCNGCGECETVCPVVRLDNFNGKLSERKAIHRLYPQAIPNVFTIDKSEFPAPCRGSCPAGVNAQGYTALIGKGKFLEALDLIRDRMPFAGICGRICHHPCEQNCNRAKIDEPVSVRNLKRFVADYERDLLQQGKSVKRENDIENPEKPERKEKIAVIGGGPAGLTCAHDLVKQGFNVTVFEAGKELGGMMRTGIPEYRLPKDYLDYEIDLLLNDGIEVRTEMALGTDFTIDDLKKQGCSSIFLAIGAQKAKRIPLDGSETEGVIYGIPFLKDISEGKKPEIGDDVVVIGGGNVAMDVARSALRLMDGGRVKLYCLESREEMPAHEWEIKEAEEEGVQMNPSWGPSKVLSSEGKMTGLEIKKCISVFDENGKFAPKFDDRINEIVSADTVILAVGQDCDLTGIDDLVETNRGLIGTDPLTLETSAEGIFSGGDAALGPASLVDAVAQGHRAAESISRYIDGKDLRTNREPVIKMDNYVDLPTNANRKINHRHDPSISNVQDRKNSFVEIEEAFTEEEAVQEAQRCLQCGSCAECMECVRTCKAHAIDHTMLPQQKTLNVGAIISTGGFSPFDANKKPEYGFGRFPNVVTSMQFERILSASGPYEGHVQRPSDGKVPTKVAWIQCVGSRDVTLGNDYCSSVCCMYAMKEAIIAKEHESQIEPAIFYIDIRAFGKGFESFYDRAKNEAGVRFVRSQISSVKENPLNHNLILKYVNQDNGNGVVEEEFDLVVLSVGLVSNPAMEQTGKRLGIETNKFGFFEEQKLLPLSSSRDGVYICGAGSGPKDIPETVMESSAAAALVSELLQSARNTEISMKEYPIEKKIDGLEPRIGVFVCHCGINIASVVNVAAVAEYVEKLPGVVHAEHTLYTCSQDTQKRIKEVIKEKDLNRLIVASCTPRTHEPLFQETMREAGLNKFLFDMADIREQCSWVHQKEPDLATEKAKSLVRGSIGKSGLLEPLFLKHVSVTKSALVIGGGISGITAAISLANQGFQVYLVEKNKELGGNLRYLRKSLEGCDWQQYLDQKINEVNEHKLVEVFTSSEISEFKGSVGNFHTIIAGDHEQELVHGIIIIAAGAGEYKPDKFLYGESDKVMTQRELESKIEEIEDDKDVVMIQCVGSRDKDHPYCSRVCCSEAMKNAIAIKEKSPDANVHILYRDIRTYGYNEIYYRKARELGVKFIHFPDERYPEVAENGEKLNVTVHDTVIDEDLTLETDLLVLSAGIQPTIDNNNRLSELLKLPTDENGNFMEAHIKLRPVDFANEGIFLCGLAHSPKMTMENIKQALAAAGRAGSVLAKDSLEVGGVVSVVDQEKCASCLTCMRECVFDAPFVNEDGKLEIDPAKCQGCGNCASACPAKAIQLMTFTDTQEYALFKNILEENVIETDSIVSYEMEGAE